MAKKQAPGGRAAAWLSWVAIAAGYTLASLVYLRPIWRVGGSRMAQSLTDPVFNLYVLKWGVRQLRLGLPDLWNANVFHPTPGALALSDHLLGPAAQLALFLEVLPNPIAGFNLLLFTSFVASALATCWVLRRSGTSWTAAVLAGWIFAFSPFRLTQLSHLQVLIAQWVPLTLWFWDRLLAERKARDAAGFLLFYLLNVTSGCYLAYMIHIPLIVLALNRWAAEGRDLLRARALRVLAPVALAAGGAAVAVFLPYVRVSESLGLQRSEALMAKHGATLASYARPSTRNLYFDLEDRRRIRQALGPFEKVLRQREDTLFAGFLPTALSLAGAVLWWRRFRNREPLPALSRGRRAVLLGLLGLALAAYLLANLVAVARYDPARWPRLAGADWLVPALLLSASLGAWALLRRHWGRGPVLRFAAMDVWERGLAFVGVTCFALTQCVAFVPLARVLPGLDGMRVPARFYVFVSLALAFFAARGTDALLARVRGRGGRLALIGGLALLLAVELAPQPVRWLHLPQEADFPAVYHWIARQDDVTALIELPITASSREALYMYFSTLHWKPIANGFSGHRPPSHRRLTQAMSFLPDGQGLDLLRELGISHAVVHLRKGRRVGELRRWELRFAQGPERRVELVFRSGPDRVYRLLDGPASSSTPNRAGLWKSAGLVRVGDQQLNSGRPSRGRSIR
jgi:hypothetical protein